MTTIETLTLQQVDTLSVEADATGDSLMLVDCDLVAAASDDVSYADLADYLDRGAPVPVLAAARRIVACIRSAEAQKSTLSDENA